MKKGLTGAQLKWIAMITMFIDHIGAVIVQSLAFNLGDDSLITPLYWSLRLIGRLSFPIYAFLLVEGFKHTSNVKKYGFNLLLFALISEIPFDLATSNFIINPSYQNIFFTLFLGLVLMSLAKDKPRWLSIIIFGIGALINEYLLLADYGAYGIILIAGIYLLRNDKVTQNIFIFSIGFIQMVQGFSVIFINAYNGKRGKQNKYFFYLFYPIHLLILYFIVKTFIPM